MTPDPENRCPPIRHAFPTVELFGLPFLDAPSEKAVVDDILSEHAEPWSTDDAYPVLVTPNVDIVVRGTEPAMHVMQGRLASCAYVLADGAPIVWASRWAGTPLTTRIAGSNLFRYWWPRAVESRRRVVVCCSADAVRDGLLAEYPDASVFVAPYIDTSESQVAQVAELLVREAIEADAEFCVVGIGHPKDPLVALAAADRWPTDRRPPLFMCLGASAEMYLGLRRRAPDWVQRFGIEWLFRFAQEPRRMFHRYFVRDLKFVPMAVREVLARRMS
jgi:N-acetylglucosaminyldiphosphoundecaprenol N-acetyl-beta-D-mannosaminyltransferase